MSMNRVFLSGTVGEVSTGIRVPTDTRCGFVTLAVEEESGEVNCFDLVVGDPTLQQTVDELHAGRWILIEGTLFQRAHAPGFTVTAGAGITVTAFLELGPPIEDYETAE